MANSPRHIRSGSIPPLDSQASGSQRRWICRGSRRRLSLESLEARSLLAATPAVALLDPAEIATPTFRLKASPSGETPDGTSGPTGLTATEIQTAYGINQITFPGGVQGTGAGQTIAIIDAYDDPNASSDLQAFDAAMGLPNPPSFSKVSQTGSTTSLPSVDTGGTYLDTWELEESLDIEWAHVAAPGANIMLVEANSDSDSDLFAAIEYAESVSSVSVISMSWGGSESRSEESEYDSVFTTPSGHQGITFVASTGDTGSPAGWPALSPNVLAVGGTTLTINSSTYAYEGETAWSDSGGGISKYEAQPSYQKGVVTQSTTKRTIPDVAFDADPNSGVSVYDTYDNGTSDPWITVGGTSLAAPSWAGLIADADQGRAVNGLATMDGRTQTLPALYSLPSSDFHDVTSGSNNKYSAGPGYDLVTGLGTPIANLLVPALDGADEPPTINSVSNVSVQENSGPQTVDLTGITPGPSDEGGGTVSIAAISSNPGLIPNPTVNYTNPNTTGTLSFTPTANLTGSAVITLTVTNGGSTANGGVNAFVETFTINVLAPQSSSTTTSLAASPGTATYSQSVGLTATISSTTTPNEGSVTFFNGTTTLGVASVANGVATLDVTSLPAGVDAITATYSDSLSNYAGSASGAVDVTIAQATPSVDVSLSVHDAGIVYTGSGIAATASVNGGSTLESVAPTLTYYVGSTVSGTGSGAPPTNAGTYTVVAAFAGSADYAAAQSDPVTFTIGPAPLIVTANGQTKAYGAALPALTDNYSGFVGDDTSASLSTQPTLSTAATATSPVIAGGYAITASGAVDSNYTISYVAGTLTVTQATPTIAVSDAGGVYSGAPFGATALVAGVVSGVDSTPAATLEGVAPTIAYYSGPTATGTPLAGAPTNPGTYTVVASFSGSQDYAAAQSAPETFAITPSPPAVTTSSGATAATAGWAAAVDPNISLADNNASPSFSATVSISSGYQVGDTLNFTDQNGITGTYSDGVLTLTGTATAAQMQVALASITFTSTSSLATRTISFSVTDSGLTSAVVTDTVDVFAPAEVTGVYVSGSGWNQNMLNYLGSHGLGSSTYGYSLLTGANQLSPLPWFNIDTISVVFNEAVNISSTALGGSDAGLINVGGVLTPATFTTSTSDGSFIATWTFASPLAKNNYLVYLPSSNVTDSQNAPLDGNYNTSTSAFPGDGLAGNDFAFQFDVLPGDATQGANVSAGAINTMRSIQGQRAATVGSNYSPFYDVEAAGSISAGDVNTARSVQGQRVATGTPTPPAGAAIATDATTSSDTASPATVVVSPDGSEAMHLALGGCSGGPSAASAAITDETSTVSPSAPASDLGALAAGYAPSLGGPAPVDGAYPGNAPLAASSNNPPSAPLVSIATTPVAASNSVGGASSSSISPFYAASPTPALAVANLSAAQDSRNQAVDYALSDFDLSDLWAC